MSSDLNDLFIWNHLDMWTGFCSFYCFWGKMENFGAKIHFNKVPIFFLFFIIRFKWNLEFFLTCRWILCNFTVFELIGAQGTKIVLLPMKNKGIWVNVHEIRTPYMVNRAFIVLLHLARLKKKIIEISDFWCIIVSTLTLNIKHIALICCGHIMCS